MGGIYEIRCSNGLRCYDINTKFYKYCQVKVKVILRPTISRLVCLGIKHPCGAYDQILLLLDTYGFVDVGRSL
jgi:hypothetical protein